MTKTISVELLQKNINTGDYGDRFADYGEGYICDLISEIADNGVDIYNYDLWEWAKNNEGWIEEAIVDGMYNIDSKDFNLMRLFMAGQYMEITSDLYVDLDNYIRYAIYDALDVEYISIDTSEFIMELTTNVDNNELLENLIDQVKDQIESEGL